MKLFEWFLGRFGVFTRKGIANIQNGNSQKKTYNTPNRPKNKMADEWTTQFHEVQPSSKLF